jgi:hypothetical protein
MTSPEIPASAPFLFIAIEASSLARNGFPIEVALVTSAGISVRALIHSEPDWSTEAGILLGTSLASAGRGPTGVKPRAGDRRRLDELTRRERGAGVQLGLAAGAVSHRAPSPHDSSFCLGGLSRKTFYDNLDMIS